MDHAATKPRLATDLPAPTRLSSAQMEQVTVDARALRARLDQATAGMEWLRAEDLARRLK
jgi:hypothetical protein